MSDNSANTKNTGARTIRQPAKGSAGCGGCLVFLLLFALVLAGLFYFWKQKNPDSDLLTTLKLPQLSGVFGGNSSSNDSNQADPNSATLSQTEPIQYQSGPTVPPNTTPSRGTARHAAPNPLPGKGQPRAFGRGRMPNWNGYGPSQQMAPHHPNPYMAPGHAGYGQAPVPSSDIVPSGYPYIASSRSNQVPVIPSHQANPVMVMPPALPKAKHSAELNHRALMPYKKATPGTLESLLLDPSTENPNVQGLQPNRIVVLQSEYYSLDEAMNEYLARLKKLGYTQIHIPLDNYEKGGATSIHAVNRLGKRLQISFKPIGERFKTKWKFEIFY
jgi:hypothetical protein